MPLEVLLGDLANLSIDQRSAIYQKYHGFVVRLSRELHSEITILCSQIKGPGMLKVRREPKLLHRDGPEYKFLHIKHSNGSMGTLSSTIYCALTNLRDCGRCGENGTALSRASPKSKARRSHKLRVTRKGSRFFGSRYEEQQGSAHHHYNLSQRRTNTASV